MLSVQEQQYFKSLIDTYKAQGYKYYLLHTDRSYSNNNIDFDYTLYFSKNEIFANSHNSFEIFEGIKVLVDTNTRNFNSNNNANYSISEFSGVVDVHKAEFVYTNSAVTYSLTTDFINPDLTWGGGANYGQELSFETFSFIVVVAILFGFFVCIFK